MKREVLDALPATLEKKWAWIQRIGSLDLGTLNDTSVLDCDDLIEARIFDNKEEIHIFRYDGNLRYVKKQYEDGKDILLTDKRGQIQQTLKMFDDSKEYYFEEQQVLRRPRFGKTLTLRHYLAFDEDGLARIKDTVLCRWEDSHDR